jgi:hypothetical protein
VEALLDSQVRVFFVTHLYHFARGAFEQNQRAVFLRAERRVDGTRPFKLVAAEPLQTSYGEDLYRAIFLDGEEGSPGLAKSGKQGERGSRTAPA